VPAIDNPSGTLIYRVCVADEFLRAPPGGGVLAFLLKAGFQDKGETGDPLTLPC
jgi:hypothetical protein